MDQSDHTNRPGVETTSLSIIDKYVGTKVFMVGGSKPFGCSGVCLENTTSHPPVIHFCQTTTNIERWVHSDWNIYIGILDISTEVQKGGFRRSSDDVIGMKPPVTIGSNWLHITRQGIL